MSQYLRVRNWEIFQHYKDRNPPWIKLHFELLISQDWVMLDDASKLLAIICMLVASRNKGLVPINAEYLQKVGNLNRKPNLKPLIDCGFLELLADASAVIADAIIETETEAETDKEKIQKESVSVESLSTFHIQDWLNEKRANGKYLMHDEHFILDYFKNYCISRGKKYKDYTAALRNAFEWEQCQPKGVLNAKNINGTGKLNKSERARAAILRSAEALGYADDGFGGKETVK